MVTENEKFNIGAGFPPSPKGLGFHPVYWMNDNFEEMARSHLPVIKFIENYLEEQDPIPVSRFATLGQLWARAAFDARMLPEEFKLYANLIAIQYNRILEEIKKEAEKKEE
jgi:hypothetical protein